MGKKLFLFLGLFLGLFFVFIAFLCPRRAQAADNGAVINEVEYDPPQSGTDSKYEWFEIYNKGPDDIILDGWTITDNNQTILIPLFTLRSKEFLVIVASEEGFKTNFSFFPDNFIDLDESIGGGLSNTGDRLILKNKSNQIIDQISWGNDNTILNPAISKYQEGHSIERKPAGLDTGTAVDFTDQSEPTPGMGLPPFVILDNPTLVNKNSVMLSWNLTEINDFSAYEIFQSTNKDVIGEIIVEINQLETNSYLVEDLSPGSYYFTIRIYNLDDLFSDSNQVLLTIPELYSKEVIVNEVLPHPETGSDYEFIELYNVGTGEVDLSGWFLDDGEGGSQPYQIPAGTKISSGGYKAFEKGQTNIILNDGGDVARLLFPNGQIASSCVYNEYAAIGLSWARDIDESWSWTTKPTAGGLNNISPPIIDQAGGDDEENLDIPINSSPIQIKTGEFRNFENYLVTISGTVVETSGNTFYLDDGSGRAKVYIQDAKDIDKPPMHRGDIFEITGIVNLYRNTWRLLPQKQDDIKLIQQVQKDTEVKISTAKKTTASTTSTKKTSTASNATARSPTDKQIVSADDINSIKVKSAKSPWWVQFFKALTGLAVILLIILIVKIRQGRKFIRTLGGNFGDET